VKLVGFEAIEGGIIIHPAVGKPKVVPVSDDDEKVAAALGAMVLSILKDEAQPEVDELEDEDDEDDYEPQPRRRRGGGGPRVGKARASRDDPRIDVPGPKPGETADDYVRRVGAEAGVQGFKALWRGLQRMSK
jgi:hypothetical protein